MENNQQLDANYNEFTKYKYYQQQIHNNNGIWLEYL